MSARTITHLLALLLALCLAFVWIKIPYLYNHALEGSALFVILYFVIRTLKNRWALFLDSFIFALLTLVFVSITGSLNSPLFFLFYILLFILSLIFEPISSLLFSLVLSLFLFNEAKLPTEMIKILSLLLFPLLAWIVQVKFLTKTGGRKKEKRGKKRKNN